MATLKHDGQGFLLGERVSLDDTAEILKDIRDDVSAIKRALSGLLGGTPERPTAATAVSSSSSQSVAAAPQKIEAPSVTVKVVAPSGRGATTWFINTESVTDATVKVGPSSTEFSSANTVSNLKVGEKAAQPRQRDSKGRFVKAVGAGAPGGAPALATATAVPGAAGAPATIGVVNLVANEATVVAGTATITGTAGVPAPATATATATPGAAGAPGLPARTSTNNGKSAATAKPVSVATPKPRQRDANGRFLSKQDQDSAVDGSGAYSQKDGPGVPGLLSDLPGRIASAIKETASGTDEADPSIKAMQEVAQPMARGYQVLFGGRDERRKESWYRRIFGEIKLFRKDESISDKDTNKRLKSIEEKPTEGEGGGGFLGLILAILAPIIGLVKGVMNALGIGAAGKGLAGLLGKALGGGAAIGAGGLKGPLSTGKTAPGGAIDVPGGGKSGGGMGKGGGMLGGAKGFLSKIPLIGLAVAAVGAAASIYSSESDTETTRKEKDENAGRSIGGLAGMLSGGALGAAMGTALGPVGTVIGGVVGAFLGDQAGQIIGTYVGGWVNDLRSYDLTGKMAAAWDFVVTGINDTVASMGKGWQGFVDSAKSKWESFVERATSGWDTIASLFKSAYEALKNLPVIGTAIKAAEALASKVAAAATTVKERVAQAGETAATVATNTVQGAKDVGQKTVDAVQRGATWAGENTTIGKGAKSIVKSASDTAEKYAPAVERAYNVTASKAGSVLEKIMPKGYRHKAMFDGIKGGDDLTKYGTYTDAEAAQIRNLKSSGANTSANLKSGMSLEVQDKIAAQARKAGLDPVMMQKMAAMESGGNPNAISSTGAIGIYQFVGQTASGVGIKDRFDVDQNIEGGMKLTIQNKAMLEGEKLPVTAENLYMMHQLGPRAAMEVIRGAKQGKAKSELSSGTQKAMNLNYGAKSKTAADYIATNKNALDARYAAVTKNTGSVSATAVAQSAAPSQKAATGGAVQAGSPSPVMSGAAPTYSAMASLPPVAATNVSLPTPPTVRPPVQPQTVSESVPVPVPLSGGANSRPIQVSVEQPDVGRDLSERRIAHVATGGIGGWVG